jgi:DNA polymerase-3 subunit gamma/tau
LDQLVSFSKGKISLNEVTSLLGIVEQEALFEITDKMIQKDAVAVLGLLNNIIDNGKDTGVFLSSLIEHFRNLMIAKVTKADAKLIDLPDEICAKLLKQSESFSMEEIFNTFNILVNTQEMSKRMESLRIPIEISLVRLTHSKKGPLVPAQSQKYTALVKESVKEKVVLQKAEEVERLEPVQPLPTISLENIKDAWQNIIDNLSRIKISVATYLNEGQPIKLQANRLVIAFPKNYSLHKEALEENNNRSIIEKGISEFFNTNLRVNFILLQEAKQKEDIQNQPFVKSALNVFGGRVINEG